MTVPEKIAAPADRGLGGWSEAGFFILTITLLNLSYAGAHAVGAHPAVFLAYAMLIAAITLLAVAGPGPEAVRIMLAPRSWVVGLGIIGMEGFYYLMLSYATPAEASVLSRLSIPLSVLTGAMLLHRPPKAGTIVGLVLVLAGVAWLLLGMPASRAMPALGLACACATVLTVRTFVAEFHPWNRQATTVIEKMRVTGLVLVVTSVAGTALVAVLMLFAAVGALGEERWLPSMDQVLHLPTFLVALLVGAVVLTAMQYLSFSSVVKIGTENFIAVTAFTPVATLAAQQVAGAVGVLKPFPVEWQLLPSIAVVTAGVLLILWAGRNAAPHT